MGEGRTQKMRLRQRGTLGEGGRRMEYRRLPTESEKMLG